MKRLRLNRDWGCTPLWISRDGDDNDLGENIDASELPISSPLQERIKRWQKPVDDYFQVMEAIPGGGWSHFTNDEFSTACSALNVSFPSPDEDREEGQALIQSLREELAGESYDVELTDLLGSSILKTAQEILGTESL